MGGVKEAVASAVVIVASVLVAVARVESTGGGSEVGDRVGNCGPAEDAISLRLSEGSTSPVSVGASEAMATPSANDIEKTEDDTAGESPEHT